MEKIGLIAVFDVAQFNKGLDSYIDGIDEANSATKGAEEDSFSFTRALEVFVGNALIKVGELALEAASKVVEFGKESVALAAEFETNMTILQTAAADSGKTVDELGEIMIAVGGDSRILGASATGAAEAATNLFKAGLKTEAVMSNLNEFMEDGAKLTGALASSFDLAAATGLEVGRASEIAAINLATFGGELETGAQQADFIQFSLDNLVKAADASVAEVADLAEALAVVGPSANNAGMSFQDTTNALALFSTAGITGSRAGTTLEATLRDLRKTTPKATESLDAMGISLFDQQGQMRPLIDIVGQLEQATADMTDEQKNNALSAIFQAQGMRGIQVLLNSGVDGWNDMADAVDGATGTQEQAELRSKTFAGQMESLDGQIETLKIRFGNALLPALGAVAGVFSELIDTHGPAIERVFSVIGEVFSELIRSFESGLSPIETIGEVLDNFLGEEQMGKVWDALEKTQNVFETVWPVIQTIVKTAWEIISQVIGVAITTLTESIFPLLKEAFLAIQEIDWEAIGKTIATVAIVIGGVLTTLLAVVTGVVNGIVSAVTEIIKIFSVMTRTVARIFSAFAKKDIKKGTKLLGKLLVDAFKAPFKVIFKLVQGFVDGFLKFFKNLSKQLVGKSIIPDMMKAIFVVIKNALDDVIKIVKEWVASVVGFFEDLAKEALEIWQALWDAIKRAADEAIGKIKKAIDDMIAAVTKAWETFANNLKSAWETMWTAIKTAVDTAISKIEKAIEAFISNIETAWATFKTNLETMWNTLWDNVKTAVSTAFTAIIGFISTGMQNILDTITGFAEDLINKGAEIVQWLIDGILSLWDSLMTAISELISGIGTTIADMGEDIIEFGREIIKFIETGIKNVSKKVSDAVGKSIEAIGTWITDSAESITQFGKDIIERMKSGIDSVRESLIDPIIDFFATLDLATFLDFWNALQDVGQAMVEGIANGITNAAGAVAGAIKGVIDGAVAAAKAKLGIACPDPSPVTRDFGVAMVEGIILGLKMSQGALQDEMKSTLNMLDPLSSPAVAGRFSGGRILQNMVSPNGGMTNNNIDNSRNITVEINSTNTPQSPVGIFHDVVAALNAVSG